MGIIDRRREQCGHPVAPETDAPYVRCGSTIGTVPELDVDEVPVVQSRTGMDFNSKSRSIIGHTRGGATSAYK